MRAIISMDFFPKIKILKYSSASGSQINCSGVNRETRNPEEAVAIS